MAKRKGITLNTRDDNSCPRTGSSRTDESLEEGAEHRELEDGRIKPGAGEEGKEAAGEAGRRAERRQGRRGQVGEEGREPASCLRGVGGAGGCRRWDGEVRGGAGHRRWRRRRGRGCVRFGAGRARAGSASPFSRFRF